MTVRSSGPKQVPKRRGLWLLEVVQRVGSRGPGHETRLARRPHVEGTAPRRLRRPPARLRAPSCEPNRGICDCRSCSSPIRFRAAIGLSTPPSRSSSSAVLKAYRSFQDNPAAGRIRRVGGHSQELVQIEIRLTWGTEATDAGWRTGHFAWRKVQGLPVTIYGHATRYGQGALRGIRGFRIKASQGQPVDEVRDPLNGSYESPQLADSTCGTGGFACPGPRPGDFFHGLLGRDRTPALANSQNETSMAGAYRVVRTEWSICWNLF